MKPKIGEVWLPKPGTVPGIEMIRIVGPYPFTVEGDEPMWIVEYQNYTDKLERVSEKTLFELWHRVVQTKAR